MTAWSLRHFLPRPVIGAVRAARQVRQRSHAWWEVANNVTGKSSDDQMVLRASLRDAVRQVFTSMDRWREPHLVADATVVVKNLGVFRVRSQSDDLGHLLPGNLTPLNSIVPARLAAGDIAIDAGANIGAVTMMMSRAVGDQGRVFAVEMMPDTAQCLRETLSLNQATNVTIVESALSDTSGKVIRATVQPGLFGQASIVANASDADAKFIDVRTTTLDEIACDLPTIALLKLDLEGAENIALAGARETLAKTKVALFESWESDGGGPAAIFRAANFKVSSVDGRNFLAVASS